jgi:hypothetical protein
MKFAYADPPYFGCALRYYGDHPDAGVYDTVDGHRALVRHLTGEFPDGWALSMASPDLLRLVPYLDLPGDCRIAAWVKPFHALKRGVRPSYGWEPVVFRGGRNRNHPPPEKGGKATTPKDFVSAPIMMKKGLTGAKPPAFNDWILDVLNVQEGDDLTDLFPGTTGMAAALTRRFALTR